MRRLPMITRRWNQSDEAKSRYVKELFSALAPRYNVMTDLWTVGLHRVWKRQAIELCALRPGERVLDVATGTGDLALVEDAAVGLDGEVVAVDSCEAMLDVGRGRQHGSVTFQEGDATDLRFPDARFDIVTIGFGLRNVADRGKALREFRRVLRPGGRLMVLDFSRPNSKPLKVIHDLLYFRVMPAAGWAFSWHRMFAFSPRAASERPTLAPTAEASKGAADAPLSAQYATRTIGRPEHRPGHLSPMPG
ncbi:MAG: ubiquinone/menaquinone biosynthesis methyltransferase [Actinomycetota bacterium]|nr:ubiquinone/menaquinone biosynthesis methyltransferase [Actinomycetota bacterium]